MRRTRSSRLRRVVALLAACACSVALAVSASPPATALSGTASFSPAESNISGEPWVSATATSGDASLALDGSLQTAWVATQHPAALTVDLGGTYDAIHKVVTVFASNKTVYKYRLQGSRDGHMWTDLANRSGNTSVGGIFTDLFNFPGLHYLKLAVSHGSPIGVREFNVYNYLRPDMDNGSDTSEQGGNTTTYYYNAGDNPPVPGIRGGSFADPGAVQNGNDFFGLTKDLGWDTIRLRVWNDPKDENSGAPSTGPGNCSPANTARVAKAVIGAGQKLAIDLHYADSWADPQKQPKPYAWSGQPFDQLVNTTYQWTCNYIKSLVAQGTTPTIVQLGNEITNGMMWGSEYDNITPYVNRNDYYKSGRYLAAPGGGVEWMKYEAANGDTGSPAYQEFLHSIHNLALLIDAGDRAIEQVNADEGTHIQSMLHFAFNVVEQSAGGSKIVIDPAKELAKVRTLIANLAADLGSMSGMVDRIGLSYYPNWHGSYSVVQRELLAISNLLPSVKLTIAEMSPPSSGTVTDPLSDPNHPVGFNYSVQSQGDDTVNTMKLINDLPNIVGTGVWPWAGTWVFGSGSGANGTLLASFKAWNDAFAKNVVESGVYAATRTGVAPTLPTTVHSLDLRSGAMSNVQVSWDPIDPSNYAKPGWFIVHGTAHVTVPATGRGIAMTAVTATVDVS